MCKLCETQPVYEFTNKRKLCKNCFVNYFHKKILYTLRKFGMIKKEDIVGYKKGNSLRDAVLERILEFAKEKIGFETTRLPSKKENKIAIASSLDSEFDNIMRILIKGNVSQLKTQLPKEKNIIKPLYLFLDEEILLYAKIKGLKFKNQKEKKNELANFEHDFEKKHPEVKRAVVNSILELYDK